MCQSLSFHHYQHNDTLYTQDDTSHVMYMLHAGVCVCHRMDWHEKFQFSSGLSEEVSDGMACVYACGEWLSRVDVSCMYMYGA